MITVKRTWPVAFVENGSTEYKVTRAMLIMGLMLTVIYTATVTGIATSVRAIPVPIKKITLLADGATVHVFKPQDGIAIARVFEQTALANLVVPPSGVAVAAYPNCEAHVPINFAQLFANNGKLTNLPSWAYDDLTLRIDWGSHPECFVGGTGNITVATGQSTITQLEAGGLPALSRSDAAVVASRLGRSIQRFKEAVQPATALTEFFVNLPTTTDLRALIITSEDANGEPTNGIINAISLRENNAVNVYQTVLAKSIRADNAKVYGVTMPTGVFVLDFAEDRDIANIYNATQLSQLDVVLNVAAVPGTIRVHMLGIDPPLSLAKSA